MIKTINYITWDLNVEDTEDFWVEKRGYYEQGVIGMINKYVKEGMIVIDVGANMGCETLPMAILVGNKGKVISFEPLTYSFNKMVRNIELNPRLKDIIILEKVALSDTKEEKADPIMRDSKYAPREVVPFITLDYYVEENKLERLDFIKIDVDGYELKVLTGAKDTLTRFKPIMVVEFQKKTLTEEVIIFLTSLEYKFYILSGNSYGVDEIEVTGQAIIDSCPIDGCKDYLVKVKK